LHVEAIISISRGCVTPKLKLKSSLLNRRTSPLQSLTTSKLPLRKSKQFQRSWNLIALMRQLQSPRSQREFFRIRFRSDRDVQISGNWYCTLVGARASRGRCSNIEWFSLEIRAFQ